jgi:alpha-L-rhamnosidase
MAQALGLKAEAGQYLGEAASLRSSINQYLFDPSTDVYPVSNLQPGSVAQDANALAVVAGVVPDGTGAKVLEALQRSLPSTPYGPLPFTADTGYRAAISPFVTNEELQALFAVGDTSSAMSLLETVWGHMDAPGPDYTATEWEGVGANGRPDYAGFTSLAHGWSTGATADLTADVLGVQPTSAGYRTWSVHPHPGSLAWVQGDVPTPRGPIAVRWAQGRVSQRFALEVHAPGGTSGTLSVPVPSTGATVTVRAVHGAARSAPARSVATSPGATSVSLALRGGPTYLVHVAPKAPRVAIG